ncbi:MAG TPA: hypothetical protein VHQ42_07570 [Candidatus Limnocylindria bacterium]|nr:hypothetical protein [Candidatus Limnocylindria bacterium]
MTEQQYMIDLDGEGRAIVDASDAEWLDATFGDKPGPTRLALRADTADTEGHLLATNRVRVLVIDEDDTEGHAIALHFPSRQEADAFRRRLLITGAVIGTVALGAVGGAALSGLDSQDVGTTGAATVATQAGPMDANEAPAFQADARANQAYADRLTAQAEAQAQARADAAATERLNAQAAAQAGPMDAHEAPAFEAAQGLSAADQAYADRLSAQAAAQAGPMDAHEAPAFQASGAATTDANRDVGIMDGSNAAAATQAGPMDAHEAPAFQADGAGAADDESQSLGGPTPR